jgi:hypothetical protein
MKKIIVFIVVFLCVSNVGMTQIFKRLLDVTKSKGPTQSEIVTGLKEALSVGADTAVSHLSSINGYYKDELVKILLPKEADVIIDNINKIPGGDELVDKVILSINRAAEDASKEAAPIFKSSITSMTISDAIGILKGADNAATEYLKKTTYNQLLNLYSPKIKISVDKDLVGNVSTSEAWNNLTGSWNKFANSMLGKLGGYKSVNINLEDYLTRKALDGLFVKIAEQEKQIRKNPLARVTAILKKVFG